MTNEEWLKSLESKELCKFIAAPSPCDYCAYRNNRKKEILNVINYFSSILERYTRTELEGSKKKSIPLTFGTLQLRKIPEKYEYDDLSRIALEKGISLEEVLETLPPCRH